MNTIINEAKITLELSDKSVTFIYNHYGYYGYDFVGRKFIRPVTRHELRNLTKDLSSEWNNVIKITSIHNDVSIHLLATSGLGNYISLCIDDFSIVSNIDLHMTSYMEHSLKECLTKLIHYHKIVLISDKKGLDGIYEGILLEGVYVRDCGIHQ